LLLCLSNDQALSHGFHDRPRHATEAVDLKDAFHLGEEPMEQPEVAAGAVHDGSDRLIL
jgi:hypothetical protein